jgi:ABC-2 type transport system permease protein
MRLLTVELDRFRSRGAVRWVGVLVLLGALLVGVSAYTSAKPPTAANIAWAQDQARQQSKDWDQQIADCKDQQAEARKSDPSADYGCDTMTPPTAQDFLPYRATFEDDGPTRLHGYWTLLLFVAAGLGVTFFCAELTSGALGNWLTFEPRRTRVYVTKAVAAFVGTGIIAVVAVAAVIAATYFGFRLQGQLLADVPPGIPGPHPHLWSDILAGGARTAVGAAVLAAVGVALGALLRHTAAALGVIVAWLGFVDALLFGLLGLDRSSLRIGIQAWVEGSATTYGPEQVCGSAAAGGAPAGGASASGVVDGGCESVTHVISAAHSGVELGAVSLGLLLLGWFVFRRRDVS